MKKRVFSPAFWRWFGKSTVVDSKGSPVVVYHGSLSPWIVSFEEERSGTHMFGTRDLGAIFFSTSKHAAEYYANTERPRPAVYDDIQVVGGKDGEYGFVGDGEDVIFGSGPYKTIRQAEAAMRREAEAYNAALKKRRNTYITPVYLRIERPRVLHETFGNGIADEIKKALASGNDGVIFSNVVDGDTKADTLIVFSSAQVKHARENDGTFDMGDRDVRSNPRRGRRHGV